MSNYFLYLYSFDFILTMKSFNDNLLVENDCLIVQSVNNNEFIILWPRHHDNVLYTLVEMKKYELLSACVIKTNEE